MEQIYRDKLLDAIQVLDDQNLLEKSTSKIIFNLIHQRDNNISEILNGPKLANMDARIQEYAKDTNEKIRTLLKSNFIKYVEVEPDKSIDYEEMPAVQAVYQILNEPEINIPANAVIAPPPPGPIIQVKPNVVIPIAASNEFNDKKKELYFDKCQKIIESYVHSGNNISFAALAKQVHRNGLDIIDENRCTNEAVNKINDLFQAEEKNIEFLENYFSGVDKLISFGNFNAINTNAYPYDNIEHEIGDKDFYIRIVEKFIYQLPVSYIDVNFDVTEVEVSITAIEEWLDDKKYDAAKQLIITEIVSMYVYRYLGYLIYKIYDVVRGYCGSFINRLYEIAGKDGEVLVNIIQQSKLDYDIYEKYKKICKLIRALNVIRGIRDYGYKNNDKLSDEEKKALSDSYIEKFWQKKFIKNLEYSKDKLYKKLVRDGTGKSISGPSKLYQLNNDLIVRANELMYSVISKLYEPDAEFYRNKYIYSLMDEKDEKSEYNILVRDIKELIDSYRKKYVVGSTLDTYDDIPIDLLENFLELRTYFEHFLSRKKNINSILKSSPITSESYYDHYSVVFLKDDKTPYSTLIDKIDIDKLNRLQDFFLGGKKKSGISILGGSLFSVHNMFFWILIFIFYIISSIFFDDADVKVYTTPASRSHW